MFNERRSELKIRETGNRTLYSTSSPSATVVDFPNREQFGELSVWVNQSFIIRLYSILQSHGYDGDVEVIRKRKFGEYAVFLKLLRHAFAHEAGDFKRERKQHKRILKAASECSIDIVNQDAWDLDIEGPLKELVENIKEYVRSCE